MSDIIIHSFCERIFNMGAFMSGIDTILIWAADLAWVKRDGSSQLANVVALVLCFCGGVTSQG